MVCATAGPSGQNAMVAAERLISGVGEQPAEGVAAYECPRRFGEIRTGGDLTFHQRIVGMPPGGAKQNVNAPNGAQ